MQKLTVAQLEFNCKLLLNAILLSFILRYFFCGAGASLNPVCYDPAGQTVGCKAFSAQSFLGTLAVCG